MVLMVSRGCRGRRNRLWRYHLGARLGEKIIDEGCNFQREVSNMQTTDRFDAGAPRPAHFLYLLKDGPVQRAASDSRGAVGSQSKFCSI